MSTDTQHGGGAPGSISPEVDAYLVALEELILDSQNDTDIDYTNALDAVRSHIGELHLSAVLGPHDVMVTIAALEDAVRTARSCAERVLGRGR